MKYLVVFEKTDQSFGAYVPDLPGCVAVANSHEEVCLLIQEAIDLHLQDLQAQGLPVPPPNSVAQHIKLSH